MQRLQDLLIKLKCVSLEQINTSIFSNPEDGLIEAIAKTFGRDQERKILKELSKALKISLASDEELEVDTKLLLPDPFALEVLISEKKVWPLGWAEVKGKQVMRVGFVDPLAKDVVEVLKDLYQAPIQIVLLREAAVVRKLPELEATIKRLASKGSESASGEISLFHAPIENREVRKAVQQVVATAIKHGADRVIVDMNSPFTSAEFCFTDGRKSSVEISIGPQSFLSGLLSLGQVVHRGESVFRAISRIAFKSSRIDCEVEYRESNEQSYEKQLTIGEFEVDMPDDPNFWFGLDERQGQQIRELLDGPSGAFLVISQNREDRHFALQSLLQSYPDSHIVHSKAVSASSLAVELAHARESRVLLGMEADDLFDALHILTTLAPESRQLVRGVLTYQRLPRLCECCAEGTAPPTQKIPSYFKLLAQEFRAPVGCEACGTSGYLGTAAISSLFRAEGYAGRKYRAGVSEDDFARALHREEYRPLFLQGVKSASLGKTSIDVVERKLPALSSTFLACMRPKKEQSKTEQNYRATELNDISKNRGKHQPIQGSGVFTSVAEDDLTLHDEGDLSLSADESIAAAKDAILVLVIDDDPDQRSILRTVFEREGYQVEVASDGIDGIVSANRLRPNCIIVDFMMPDFDGRDTIRKLKGSDATKEIPIVALTAHASSEVELAMLKAGADEFCPKSVSKKVLLKRVERLLS